MRGGRGPSQNEPPGRQQVAPGGMVTSGAGGYWMLAVTLALPVSVKVHEVRFEPLEEHAPDQMADLPLSTDRVICLPATNVAELGSPTEE